MFRRLALPMAIVVGLAVAPSIGDAAGPSGTFTAGSPGIGDPYFPTDGNGGYDVRHYDLTVRYDPNSTTDHELAGVTVIEATAKQNLSRFNLDLKGLTVTSVTVGFTAPTPDTPGAVASWSRSKDELIVTPAFGVPNGHRFYTRVEYHGKPFVNPDAVDGFVRTRDGAVVMGEPHTAATWYPVNDHPSDKATYDVHIAVPSGLEAVSNGALINNTTTRGWTTWNWQAVEPIASYLTMAAVGHFQLTRYQAVIAPRPDSVAFVDAVDPELFTTPFFTGNGALLKSAPANQSYQRLIRNIVVPRSKSTPLEFEVIRGTELKSDFMVVEVAPLGSDGRPTDQWTTLFDLNGHTTNDVGDNCPTLQKIHPWLSHYQSAGCKPAGSSGHWWAATGTSTADRNPDRQDRETWKLDLGAYAGQTVQVSISYVSDEFVQGAGVFIDNISVANADGSTSFEADGNQMDGWVVAPAPPGSPLTHGGHWTVGSPEDLPRPGAIAAATFGRQTEFLRFLSAVFGPYPFRTAGGVMDAKLGLDSSLETQTRPVYAREHFSSFAAAEIDVVHELAHQWFGNGLTIKRWRDIWLSEGFATYAEWLWSDHLNPEALQHAATDYCSKPANDEFWKLKIADPGAEHLFDAAVYYRGALTLQQLQKLIGGKRFGTLLRSWAQGNASGLVTTADFISLAKRQNPGVNLDTFFNAWLFSTKKPVCLTS